MILDEALSQQAKSNSIQNFKYGFEDVFLTKLIERMDFNQDIFTKIIDDKEFGEAVRNWMLRKVYNRLTQEANITTQMKIAVIAKLLVVVWKREY